MQLYVCVYVCHYGYELLKPYFYIMCAEVIFNYRSNCVWSFALFENVKGIIIVVCVILMIVIITIIMQVHTPTLKTKCNAMHTCTCVG